MSNFTLTGRNIYSGIEISIPEGDILCLEDVSLDPYIHIRAQPVFYFIWV